MLTVFLCLTYSSLWAKPLHYLYINAREGSSSGGHTALRFANETYHFQHYDGGIIRLVRQDSDEFNFQYRYLDNRSVFQASLELTESGYRQLRDYFNRTLLQQEQQDKLLNELALNRALLLDENKSPLLAIKGAGLLADNTLVDTPQTAIIQQFQAKIQATYGKDFLQQEITRYQQEISQLAPAPWTEASLSISTDTYATLPYSFASQHLAAVRKILFLQAMQQGLSLNKQHYFIPQQTGFELSETELKQLSLFQHTLINNLLSLLQSPRPDWGSSAFVLYARTLSLSLAIDSGRLVLLNSFSADSTSIPYTEVVTYHALLTEQRDLALARIIEDKQRLLAAEHTITEQQYSQLEMLSNFFYEREQGFTQHRAIRVNGEQRLADKAIPLPERFLSQLDSQQRQQALERIEGYKVSLEQQIQTLYQYNLFTRNCVTEIFDTINKADIQQAEVNELAQLAHNKLIAFIPVGSFYSLPNDYQKQDFPSFRQQQLDSLYQQQENNMLTYLREFNTLSSSSYVFNEQDSMFLFFTDDVVWNRPLLGSINLLSAAGYSVYGSLKLPFDSGESLSSGLMGMVMSLPELAFFNIRKGSYKHLVRE